MKNKKQIKTQTHNAKKIFDVRRMFQNDRTTEMALTQKFNSTIKDTLELVWIGANTKETIIGEEAKELADNCNDFIGAMRGYGFLSKLTETL